MGERRRWLTSTKWFINDDGNYELDPVIIEGDGSVESFWSKFLPYCPADPKPPTHVVLDDDDTSSGGPGGGPSNPPQTTPKEPTVTANPAPYAKKLFRGNLTDAEWKQVERMMEKIMNDCMGGNLYNTLDTTLGGKTWEVVYDSSLDNAKFTEAQVQLNNLSDPYALMHELFHGYQAYQETPASWDGATANMEVEAQIAKVRFMLGTDDIATAANNRALLMRGTTIEQQYVKMNNALNSNGNLINSGIESAFMRNYTIIGQEYARQIPDRYTWNPNRTSFADNMKNIQRLTKDC